MPQGEKPKHEPEIIPPDRGGSGKPRPRVFFDAHGTERVYVARVGPLGYVLAMLVAGIMLAVLLALLAGALLFALPLLIAFIVGAIIAAFLRPFFRARR